jgi:glutathione peroxidase
MVESLVRRALLAITGGTLMTRQVGAQAPAGSAYDFTFPALEGGELKLADFQGQVLLVVNTASFCGFTPQFRALEALYDRYRPRGFSVIGVPSNDFNQEAAEAEKIRAVCDTFDVDFPLAAVSHVKGEAAHPFFRWAGGLSSPPRWNFHKYLIAADGRFLRDFSTRVAPDSAELTQAIEGALVKA